MLNSTLEKTHTSRIKHLPLLLLLILAACGWLQLKLNKDLLAIFPQDTAEVETMRDIRHNFEHGGRLLVQLHSEQADQLSHQAEDLATFISEHKLTSSIHYRPVWEEDKHVQAELLAYLWINNDTEAWQQLVEKTKPNTLPNTIQSSQEELALTFDPLEITKLARDPLEFLNHPSLPTSEGSNPFVSENGKTQLLILYPVISDDSSGDWCAKISTVLDKWQHSNPEATLSYTGSPAFAHEIAQNIKTDVIITIIISSIFSAVIFWMLVRQHRLIHIQLSLVACILLVTYGIGALILPSMSLMSIGFASILIGLAVDYGMIICTEAKRSNNDSQALLANCLRPILFASISTAVVFAALALSELPGIQELGTLVAIGILISAYTLLVYFTPFAARISTTEKNSHNPAKTVLAYSRKTQSALILCMIALCTGLIFIGFPKINFDLHAMTPHHSEAKQHLESLNKNFPNSINNQELSIVLSSSNATELLQKIKQQQALSPSPNTSLPLQSLIPKPSLQAANLKLASQITARKQEILTTLENSGYQNEAIQLNQRLLEHFHTYTKSSDLAFPSHPVLLNWFSTFMLTDSNKLHVLTTGNQAIEQSSSTSWKAIEQTISDKLPRDILEVLAVVLLLIFPLLFFALKKLKHALLGGLCLLTPIALIVWLVHLTPIEWNFLNVFTVPLLLGMGVDYVIHIVIAGQKSSTSDGSLTTSLQRTLIACGSTTVIGFLALTLAKNQALASLGLLCAIGMVLTMLFCLILLPKLVLPRDTQKS